MSAACEGGARSRTVAWCPASLLLLRPSAPLRGGPRGIPGHLARRPAQGCAAAQSALAFGQTQCSRRSQARRLGKLLPSRDRQPPRLLPGQPASGTEAQPCTAPGERLGEGALRSPQRLAQCAPVRRCAQRHAETGPRQRLGDNPPREPCHHWLPRLTGTAWRCAALFQARSLGARHLGSFPACEDG